jgi:hypothetical protein
MSFTKFWRVPRLWPGETLAILASGPSLTQEQATLCRGRARAIAVNDSYLLAPWADLHYFCDAKWYEWHRKFESPAQALFGRERALALFHGFQGVRVTIEPTVAMLKYDPSMKVLRNDSRPRDGKPRPEGLCLAPDGIRTGRNSGFQAINLAVHTGIRRILLLGYDMRAVDGKSHWFGEHPRPAGASIYESTFLPAFQSLIQPLEDLGVEVINCTPESALKVFPRRDLADCL